MNKSPRCEKIDTEIRRNSCLYDLSAEMWQRSYLARTVLVNRDAKRISITSKFLCTPRQNATFGTSGFVGRSGNSPDCCKVCVTNGLLKCPL